jgi:hypothetical protein
LHPGGARSDLEKFDLKCERAPIAKRFVSAGCQQLAPPDLCGAFDPPEAARPAQRIHRPRDNAIKHISLAADKKTIRGQCYDFNNCRNNC